VANRSIDAAANAALDETVARMGADVCIWSVALAIDEIASDLAGDADEEARVRSMLRGRFGLTT
jgi:hypothetical protein